MRFIPILICCSIAVSACTTTRYVGDNASDSSFSFGGTQKNQKIVGTVHEEFKQHYFLFGLISSDETKRLNDIVRLRPNQRLVNLELSNSKNFIDGVASFLGCVFTFCLVNPVIWETRTTTVKGDIVEVSSPTATASASN